MSDKKYRYLSKESHSESRKKVIKKGVNPQKVFPTFEEFEEYSDEIKKYIKDDAKFSAYLTSLLADMMDSLCNCIRMLVLKERLNRKDAMMMLAMFNDEQKERTLGKILNMSLSLTSLCRSADIIPEGVDVFETKDGVGLGVNDNIDEEDMSKFVKDFDGGQVVTDGGIGAKA